MKCSKGNHFLLLQNIREMPQVWLIKIVSNPAFILISMWCQLDIASDDVSIESCEHINVGLRVKIHCIGFMRCLIVESNEDSRCRDVFKRAIRTTNKTKSLKFVYYLYLQQRARWCVIMAEKYAAYSDHLCKLNFYNMCVARS